MADSEDVIQHASDAGTVASQSVKPPQPFRVAPTTGSEFNVLAQDLTPVACISLNDIAFEFDSSFVKPRVKDIDVATILKFIPILRQRHRTACGQPPLASVFGHADPTGTVEYNKQLSGRRATAVYGLLTHRSDLWLNLYNDPFGGDDWKKARVADTMRNHVGEGAPTAVDELIQVYMALLCPTKLEKTDFLGRGQAGGKADLQGCGKFNPVMVFSKDEAQRYSRPENHQDRDSENQINRRVVIYFFRGSILLDPSQWQCPRALEDASGCRPRFFVNGDQRQSPAAKHRVFPTVKDTFGCRFYDRIAHDSPCESPAGRRRYLRILVRDVTGEAIVNENYRLEIDGVLISTDADLTDGRGMVRKEISWEATTGVLTVRTHVWEIKIETPPPHSEEAGARVRLANLGYFPDAAGPDDAGLCYSYWDFQHANQIDRTAELDDPTVGKLDQIHSIE